MTDQPAEPSTDANSSPAQVVAATARQWMDDKTAILIDVREAAEYEYENVPGSVLLPLSFLDADSFPPLNDRKVVFMCAIGKRGEAARKQLADSGLENLYNLTGGINAWKDAGLETQGGKFEAMDYSI